jgi:hypothetical protein
MYCAPVAQIAWINTGSGKCGSRILRSRRDWRPMGSTRVKGDSGRLKKALMRSLQIFRDGRCEYQLGSDMGRCGSEFWADR